MSKYAPLTQFLKSKPDTRLPLTFAELERLLGFPLPPSARKHRAWWANNPASHVNAAAWHQAGFQSEQVDLEAEKLVFVKLNALLPTGAPADPSHRNGGRHPLIGCMAGTFTLMPGIDLTEPTEPDWTDQLLEKFDRLLGHKA